MTDPSLKTQHLVTFGGSPCALGWLVGWLVGCVTVCVGCQEAVNQEITQSSASVVTVDAFDAVNFLREEEGKPEGLILTSTTGVEVGQNEADLRAPSGPDEPKASEAIVGETQKKEDDSLIRLQGVLSTKAPDEVVPVLVSLPDVKFPWQKLGNLSEAHREQALALRKKQVSEAQLEVVESLKATGAEKIETFLLTPSVSVWLSAKQVTKVAALEGVVGVAAAEQLESEPELHYTGIEVRSGTKVSAFETAGFTGSTNGRAGGAIRLAVFDDLNLNTLHPGFSRWGCAGVPPFQFCGWIFTSFATTKNCSVTDANNRCSDWTPVVSKINNPHGQAMAGIINGTIEGGQDSNHPTTVARKRRSGFIPQGGTSLYYYGKSGTSAVDFVRMLDTAIFDQIDAIDVSQNYSPLCGGCDHNCSAGSAVISAIRNATMAGVLVVKSAGNEGPSGCTTTFPAGRPEVLAVGGLNSTPNTASYDTLGMLPVSSKGGMNITVNGTDRSTGLSVVGLLAPAEFDYEYLLGDSSGAYTATTTYAETDPTYPQTPGGTSQAAASMTGAAGLLRQASKASGYNWSGFDLLTNMLLMGDSFAASVGSSSYSQTRFDPLSGSGRAHMHYPSSQNLGPGDWGWGSVTGTLSHGQSNGWFIMSGTHTLTQLKVAMTFEENDLANAGDLDLSVYNACAGTGHGIVIKSDISYDVKSRVNVLANQAITQPPSCWGVKVYAAHVPTGQTRKFHLAWYWHNQSPTQH